MGRWFRVLIFAAAMTVVTTACDRETEGAKSPPASTTGPPEGSVAELLDKLPEASAPAAKAADIPDVQFYGKFGTNGALPTPDGERLVEVDPRAVAELNIVAQFRVESAFAERKADPSQSVLVQFGGAEDDDGLLVTVRYKGRAASRKVVPADNGPELVANFDHTIDRALDELGVPRKLP